MGTTAVGYAPSGTSVPNGLKAERASGRVQMATRRLENLRERTNSALLVAHAELDRLAGHRPPMPENAIAGRVPTAVPIAGEAAALEREVESLEQTLSYVEDLCARLGAL